MARSSIFFSQPSLIMYQPFINLMPSPYALPPPPPLSPPQTFPHTPTNNCQSARSSTSSLGEEATPLPPLPVSSISTATFKTNGKMYANDPNANLELQQHIIPPRKLSQNHSTSELPCTSPIAIIIHHQMRMTIGPSPSRSVAWSHKAESTPPTSDLIPIEQDEDEDVVMPSTEARKIAPHLVSIYN